MQLSVVVPAFNERGNLAPLIDELDAALAFMGNGYEIIVVDDGSTDGTFAALQELQAGRRHLKAIAFRRNAGQSAAIDAGFRHASGEFIVTLDADRQNDPRDIRPLLDKLREGYDVVSGVRTKRRDPRARVLISRAANALIRRLLRSEVTDLGCTLKAYRRSIVQQIKLYGEMHRFVGILAAHQGARIGNLEVNHRPRIAGKSKYGFERTIKVVLDSLTVWFLAGFQTKPIYVFGTGGLGMIALSWLTALVTLYEKFAMDAYVHRNPLFQISLMLFLMGLQSLAFGLLAEVLVRTYFESQGKTPYIIAARSGFAAPPIAA